MDELITYRFTRLSIGLTCSPFLLSATIRTLATMYHDTYPTAYALVDRSTYVDDFAASAIHDIITIFFKVTSLMNTINLCISGLQTPPTCRIFGGSKVCRRGRRHKTSAWIGTTSLTRSTSNTHITRALPERPAMKRLVLQVTSRFYDPHGWFSPVPIVGKILFQDTWKRRLA